ncbi:MAG: kynureninase [Rhodothermia bacterium]
MSVELMNTGVEEAARRDESDPLAVYRERFHVPVNWIGEPVVYLCGNSLGLQPIGAIDFVEHELRQWREIAVEGHFTGTHPWMPYHEFVTDGVARIVGALSAEVIAMNTLTVNLHLMMVSFYRPSGKRRRIAIESRAFPSDRYAAASQISFHGLDPATDLVELEPRTGEHTLRTSDIVEFLDREGSDIALVLLGGVNYYSGQLLDIPAITEAGHRNGCVVGFDLAHAVGNVSLQLHDWDVDFAVWCSYKYLNAGPGGIAGAFVHERHLTDRSLPRFAGWWGHEKSSRFSMPRSFKPIPTAEGWQISNPAILTLAALRASLEVFDSVGMDRLRKKSTELTRYLESALLSIDNRPFEIITPSSSDERGAQLSLLFKKNARESYEALKIADVVCDFREPDVIRIAPVPLYNTYADAQRFADIIAGQI